MFMRAFSVIVAATLSLSACSSDSPRTAPSQSPSASPRASTAGLASTAVPTNPYTPGMAWPTALGRGNLTVVTRGPERCFVLVDRDRVTDVTWPAGFTARWSHPASLIGPNGQVIATEGEFLYVGGGVGRPRNPTACAASRETFGAGPISVGDSWRYGPGGG